MPAITRRDTLAQTAALLSLPVLAAVPAAMQTTPEPVTTPPIGAAPADHPDAELIDAAREFFEADRLFNAYPADKQPEKADQAMARWYAALERSTALLPTTDAGLAAKAHVALAAMRSVACASDLQREEAAGMSALECLLQRRAPQ